MPRKTRTLKTPKPQTHIAWYLVLLLAMLAIVVAMIAIQNPTVIRTVQYVTAPQVATPATAQPENSTLYYDMLAYYFSLNIWEKSAMQIDQLPNDAQYYLPIDKGYRLLSLRLAPDGKRFVYAEVSNKLDDDRWFIQSTSGNDRQELTVGGPKGRILPVGWDKNSRFIIAITVTGMEIGAMPTAFGYWRVEPTAGFQEPSYIAPRGAVLFGGLSKAVYAAFDEKAPVIRDGETVIPPNLSSIVLKDLETGQIQTLLLKDYRDYEITKPEGIVDGSVKEIEYSATVYSPTCLSEDCAKTVTGLKLELP